MSTKAEIFKQAFYSTTQGIRKLLIDGVIGLMTTPRQAVGFWGNVNEYYDLNGVDPVLSTKPIQDIIAIEGEPDIYITGSYYSKKASDTRILMELAVIGYLMQALKPNTVFEIGTFVGRTTRIMAINSPAFTKIYTLDLPPRDSQAGDRVGCEYRKAVESAKITQLYGNSYDFDFSPFRNQCDFVWIDGNHDYAFVKKDSENALRICKPGGWIGWHDYRHSASWSGVTQCIRELKRQHHREVIHIKGTTIALMKKK